MKRFELKVRRPLAGMVTGMGFNGIVCMLGLVGLAWALAATPAWADSKGHGKGHGGAMKMGACQRMMKVTAAAEKQMGGAHYKGAMPKTSSMAGMPGMKKGKAMKMSGGAKSMPGMKEMKDMPGMGGAHGDHDAKVGGVLFMAPNKLHHLEGSFDTKCGFQVYLYNAFTKPIHISRFQAFIKFSGEVNGEDVETIRFLSPNKAKTILRASPPHGLKAPFEVELHVKFPEGDDVEVFNFAVDKHGKIS